MESDQERVIHMVHDLQARGLYSSAALIIAYHHLPVPMKGGDDEYGSDSPSTASAV